MTDQELNEAVARKLGFEAKTLARCGALACEHELKTSIPDYSHSIAAAWDIVELPGIGSQSVHRTIYPQPSWEWSLFKDGKMYLAEAATAPLAICQAFLKLP